MRLIFNFLFCAPGNSKLSKWFVEMLSFDSSVFKTGIIASGKVRLCCKILLCWCLTGEGIVFTDVVSLWSLVYSKP